MRHQRKRHKLGRSASHRKATLGALSAALIEHKRITTTIAKAKALRPFIEPLITRAKKDTTHNRRQVFRRLQDKRAIAELFGDVAEQVADRPGGYTRVIKLGQRFGDGTEMAMVELVDYNDVQPEGTSSSSSRTRRGSGKGRRRKKKQAATDASTTPSQDEDATTQDDSAVEDKAEDLEDPTTNIGPAESDQEDDQGDESETPGRSPEEEAAANAGKSVSADPVGEGAAARQDEPDEEDPGDEKK